MILSFQILHRLIPLVDKGRKNLESSKKSWLVVIKSNDSIATHLKAFL